ncbi:ACT domain-containing protein [Defluviimonas sp. SAOS-178_SWC]|uniref:ACT domain-containing protein n=1 Tax=Defluviimonas sp. SAOS-178_SWC TaxID=3121287 RepID=UPI0032217D6F
MTNPPRPISDGARMIVEMTPELLPGEYVFCTIPAPDRAEPLIREALAIFREEEGLSLILARDRAAAAGVATDAVMRCIRLNVYSALDGVGLTAAVAGVLAEAGIACNMVAAFHHDHAFVPADRAEEAVALLVALQSAGTASH